MVNGKLNVHNYPQHPPEAFACPSARPFKITKRFEFFIYDVDNQICEMRSETRFQIDLVGQKRVLRAILTNFSIKIINMFEIFCPTNAAAVLFVVALLRELLCNLREDLHYIMT